MSGRFLRAIGVAAMALALAVSASAQPLPSNRDDIPFSYASLVKKVSPAVVNIYTATTARVQRRLPFPIPGAMALASRVMKTIAYRI